MLGENSIDWKPTEKRKHPDLFDPIVYQSLGLGRIAAASKMNVFYRLMPGCAVWLDTQT